MRMTSRTREGRRRQSGKIAFGATRASYMVCFAVFALGLLAPPTAPAQQSKPWENIAIPPLRSFSPHQPKRIEL